MRLTLFIFPLETVYWYLAPTKWDFLFFLWLWIKYLFSGVWLMLWPSYRTCYGNKAGGWHCSVDSSIFFFQSTIVVSISDKKKELQKFLRHSIPFSHSSPTVKVSVDENSVCILWYDAFKIILHLYNLGSNEPFAMQQFGSLFSRAQNLSSFLYDMWF